jgi:ATP synthase protein I
MVEPERELVRRALPFALPALVVAFTVGALLGGADVGWSATIGVAVVAGNFVAYGLSLAWAARISPTILMAVGLGGFVVRLAVVVALMAGLGTMSWFSPLAFLAAVVPSTVLLLGFEMKVLSGRLQADLWRFPSQGAR